MLAARLLECLFLPSCVTVFVLMDCCVVGASLGGIASMVAMTGATAWTGMSSGGIASMVAITGATAWTGASSSSPPWWR